MNSFLLVFVNSFQSFLIVSFTSEYAWSAALGFGGYDMTLLTVTAVLGSTLAMSINFALGYYTSTLRAEWFYFSEELYQRISLSFRRYFVFLLLVPPLPFLPFVNVLAAIAGVFRVPPLLAFGVIIVGRVGYYSYFLLHH